MIEIHFPDKTTKSYEEGVTPIEIAQSISEGLARNVLSAEFNGETVEANTPLFKMVILSCLLGKIKRVKKHFGILLPMCLLKQFYLFTLKQN